MDKPLPQRCRSISLVLFAFAFAVSASAEERSIQSSACFAAGPALATKSAPASVAVGDLNGDGNPDLAVANGVSNGVALFFGDGAGGFSAPSGVFVGLQNVAVATADFNGDGLLDLAVGTSANVPTGVDDLAIFLGTGGGAFAPPQYFGLGNSISRPSASIAVADFNRDGKLDVALGHTNLNSVSIFLGNGAGSFSLAGVFNASFQSLFSIAVSDFNGDGNPDVVGTLDFAGSVSVLLGTGTGALGSPTLFAAPPLPIGVAVGDFNGDGQADLAVANEAGTITSILIGDGLGGFGSPATFPAGTGSRAVVVADFDTDGRPDVAVANEQSANVSVLLGDGNGGFGPTRNFGVGTFPRALAVGDFDRDGLPDLAVANVGSDSVSILLNAAPTILPVSLPPATVNTNYPPIVLSGSGGTPPYTFTASNNLPLAFDPVAATLYGILGSATPRIFSITITDASGCSSTRSYSLTVNRADVPLTLTSSVNPALPNQTIRFTATLTFSLTGPATPTGSVTFFNGSSLIGAAPVNVRFDSAQGVFTGDATIDISTLAPGRHVLTAAYSGDGNFNASTSPILTQILSIPEVPTLDEIGRAALVLFLAAAALFVLRFRS